MSFFESNTKEDIKSKSEFMLFKLNINYEFLGLETSREAKREINHSKRDIEKEIRDIERTENELISKIKASHKRGNDVI